MFDKKLLLTILIAVLIFLVGVGVGVIFMQFGPQKTKIQTAGSLSSKAVSSIVAYGQVKAINGTDITLSNLGDDLQISVSENAPVYSFAESGASASVQQKVAFSTIKIGDKLNISVKLLKSGKFEGSSVIILPN